MINNYIKALPLTEQKVSAWKNKVANSLNAHNVIAGSGIRIDYGPDGATIALDELNNQLSVGYVGDYDINAEYYPNQIVRVRPDKAYTDIANQSIDLGSTADTGYTTCPMSPGLYICVNYVPPGACDETWLNTVIAPMYPQGIPFNLVQGTRFNTYNVYYPVFPEFPTNVTASVSVLNNTSTIIANNTFWNALPIGMRAMNMCLADGTLATAYVSAYISGSACLSEYYPYQP